MKKFVYLIIDAFKSITIKKHAVKIVPRARNLIYDCSLHWRVVLSNLLLLLFITEYIAFRLFIVVIHHITEQLICLLINIYVNIILHYIVIITTVI